MTLRPLVTMPVIGVAAAILCAQQNGPSIDGAAAQCRIIERTADANAKVFAQNPRAAQSGTDRIKPVLDACAAFQAEPNAQTASGVINAMGDYDPQTLPPQQRLAQLET